MTNAITVTNLVKKYKSKNGEIIALNKINLEIPKGSFFGILGPNGAGKSTFINILSSLITKNQGKILINNIDFDQNINQAKHLLGVVPQEIALDPFFSVTEMLKIYAGYYGVKRTDKEINKIISALGLTKQRNDNPRSLSGGMKRRLLIAKALIHDPEIIILDEPTAGVDIELREKLWEYINKLNKEFGKTIILTTHYLEEAEQLCDMIAIINKGKIITCDKKENLKKIFGNKKLILTLAEQDKNLITKLNELGNVTLEENKVIFTYKIGKFSYDNLIKILAESKAKINEFSTKESNIEEIFKELVK